MLFKHSTQAARDAVFGCENPPQPPAGDVPAAPQPDERDLAMTVLAHENEALRAEIAQLRASWQEELARAERRARDAAARDHVRDDEKRLATLNAALGRAHAAFVSDCLARAEAAAREIAAVAVGKLVAARQGEQDWLARVIARRIEALGGESVVALRLSSGEADGAAEALAAVPPGTRLEADPTLRPGTARLALRLGTIDIDPREGAAQVLAVLREDRDDG